MQKDIFLANKGLLDINPLLCGEEVCEPDQDFGPAARPYYLLHYVISGAGILISNKKTYRICKGQIFVIKPYENVYYKADKNNPWYYNWVGFESSLDLSAILSDVVIDCMECQSIFSALRECRYSDILKEFYICSKIYELLSILGRSNTKGLIDPNNYVLEAKNYIETNYMYDISVEKIACSLNLSTAYFSRIFKKYLNKSPQEYIIDFRLNKASELISFRGYRTKEAAISTGYKNISHFCKIFKRRFGVTPLDFHKSK